MVQSDTIKTSVGNLEMTFIGHGTLMFQYDDKVIHVDPVSEMGDYSSLPKADIILITHEHHDHFDPVTIEKLRKDNTDLVVSEVCAKQIENGIIMKNGDRKAFKGIAVAAVPAYNIIHMRSPGQPFHPKGMGNGYVLTFGDKHIYVAGDTENIPEMKQLSNMDIAFLPMNLPYTMTPEMAAKAALSFRPKILYPYHFGDTEPSKLIDLLKDHPEIEVRVRDLQ